MHLTVAISVLQAPLSRPVTGGSLSTKLYDNRDDFSVRIVLKLLVTESPVHGVYISRLTKIHQSLFVM